MHVVKIVILRPKDCKQQTERINPTVKNKIKKLNEHNKSVPKKDSSKIIFDEKTKTRIQELFLNKSVFECTSPKTREHKDPLKVINLSNELRDTEQRYLETLRILKDISDNIYVLEFHNIDQLKPIFNEIPSLYGMHLDISNVLSKSTPNFEWKSYAELLTRADYGPFFNIYKSFLAHYSTTYELLNNIYKSDKKFQNICKTIIRSSSFEQQHQQDVCGMYIGIHSRLCRILILFKNLLRYFDNETDKRICREACIAIQGILQYSEEEVDRKKSIMECLSINEKIDGRKRLTDRIAEFIHEGPAFKVSRRSEKRLLQRHLFLFSDYFVITEFIASTSRYKTKSELTVISMSIEELRTDDIEIMHCFRVKAAECVIELSFKSENDKNIWWEMLRKTIEIQRKKHQGSDCGTTNPEFAPEWEKDDQVTMCGQCFKKFTTFNRKHHCRACGKIFCQVCSDYKSLIKHSGGKEERVCMVDYYNLNPDKKPETPADMEILTRINTRPIKRASVQYGYLKWLERKNSQWKKISKKKALPIKSSNLNVDQPNVLSFSLDSLPTDDNTFTLPLPDERLVVNPMCSSVYCSLQPDTLFSIFVGQKDGMPYRKFPLLGMRLVYLAKISNYYENKNRMSTRLSNLSLNECVNQTNSNECSQKNRIIHSLESFSEAYDSNLITNDNSIQETTPTICPSTKLSASDNIWRSSASSTTACSLVDYQDHPDINLKSIRENAVFDYPCSNSLNQDTVSFKSTLNSVLNISQDTLSVLTNTLGILLLPLQSDSIGDYFEASSEETRDEWIKNICNSVEQFINSD